MSAVCIRPLIAQDAPAAQEMSYLALRDSGTATGWSMPELTDEVRARGRRRILHALTHDPAGAWIAELHGEIVGVALATRREGLWFLSLLAVSTSAQDRGIGRSLLTASLATLGPAGALCASDDPKALRRYHAAGFDLAACYQAKGPLDRALLPAVTGVRAASYDDDRAFVEHLARQQRGAIHGPDLDFFREASRPLFVIDSTAGQGYVIGTDAGVAALAATTPDAAQSLLWTALAESTDEVADVGWLRPDQRWAIDVAMRARLSLRPRGTFCTRGAVGPMSPYIPSGAFG